MNSGSLIKLLRTAENVSQSELAKLIDVSQAYLSQVERGKREPSIAVLRNAAVNLKIPLALLFVGDEPKGAEGQIFRELRNLLGKTIALYASEVTHEKHQTSARASYFKNTQG